MYIDIVFNRSREHLQVTFIMVSDMEASHLKKAYIQVPDIPDRDWIRDTKEFGESICPEYSVKNTTQDFKLIVLEIKTTYSEGKIREQYEEFFNTKYPPYMSMF